MEQQIEREDFESSINNALLNARAKLIARYPDYEQRIKSNLFQSENDIRESVKTAWEDYYSSNDLPSELLEVNVQDSVLESLITILLLGLYKGLPALTNGQLLQYMSVWHTLKEIWKILTEE